MTITHAIGIGSNKIIRLIVRALALSRIHPNVLTFLGLLINMIAAWMLAVGQFRWGAAVIIGAGLFDMVDGRVARETNRVTRFGGFFDSVLDRYSDLALLVGLLVWYGSINRFGYVVLTAIAMTASTLPGDNERCLAAGMDHYTGKPIHPASLDEILALAINRTDVSAGR